MTAPMDPNELEDGPTEFDYGPGMFAPGVARNEGQRHPQDDFGQDYGAYGLGAQGNTEEDNFARAVADRRTDSTDPESGRDFDSLGNPDRYGGQPPLVRAEPQPNKPTKEPEYGMPPLQRKW